MMFDLNLPPFEPQLRRDGEKVFIYDVVRKKYLVMTPEEWVRQHFVHYLTEHLGYPRSLIRIEGGLTFNQRQKRSDIVVFDRDGKPWMLIECKSPDTKLSQRTVDQAATYNAIHRAPFLVVTNGIVHLYFSIDWERKLTTQVQQMPPFQSADFKGNS